MHVAFDGTTLRPERTGVGYYTEHLLRHLLQCGDDVELSVISDRPIETTSPLPSCVRVPTGSWTISRLLWMQTIAPRVLRDLRPDVAHFTNGMTPLASPVPTGVTIHDMSLTLYPRYHPPRRVLLNRPLVNMAARRADAIITVSESAKRDILDVFGLAPDRVHVVHEAAAPSFRRVQDQDVLDRVRARYGLAERFILYVGTIEPRKNLLKLCEGFARRRAKGDLPHQLVCAGPYGWLSRGLADHIARLGIAEPTRFTGYVPFEDLPALYTLAEMFVFPSLYEGFGLPVVEAMACGTPVITGRVAALSEVTGDAVEHVDDLEPDAIGDALARLSADEGRRQELSSRGLERARRFSWERAARETVEISRRVAGRPAIARKAPVGFASGHAEPLTGVGHPHAAARETQP